MIEPLVFEHSSSFSHSYQQHVESFPSLFLNEDSSSNHYELLDFPAHEGKMDLAFPLDDEPLHLDWQELDLILSGEIDDVSEWLKGVEESCPFQQSNSTAEKIDHQCSLSPSVVSNEEYLSLDGMTSIQQPLVFPDEDKEINKQICLNHLVQAYVEAMENNQPHLAEVTTRRITEKVSPTAGEIKERLLYYSTWLPLDKQAEYLKQESSRNFDRALETFYRILPYGKIAHFTANEAILQAKPHDAEVLHVVDFDMGEGVQWSSMIMALAQQQNYYGHDLVQQKMTLKISAIKWREESNDVPLMRRFEETKRLLHDYAQSFGLRLQLEEMELQDLVTEMKRMRKRRSGERRKEWLAFNCMWALPHMGRRRSRRQVMKFLRVAKESLAISADSSTSSKGILTFGDGGGHNVVPKNFPAGGFRLFFESYMEYYHALLQSMEWTFPICLPQARIAMECLFVAPYVSSVALVQNWEEMKDDGCEFKMEDQFGFEGKKLREESLMEAKEMVSEGGPYQLRIEGENDNELVLSWKGTPLVRVSAWI